MFHFYSHVDMERVTSESKRAENTKFESFYTLQGTRICKSIQFPLLTYSRDRQIEKDDNIVIIITPLFKHEPQTFQHLSKTRYNPFRSATSITPFSIPFVAINRARNAGKITCSRAWER